MRYADSSCKMEETFTDGVQAYTFTGKCVLTGKQYSVTVPAEELFAYRSGQLMQHAMKSLNADQREFLMSGISPLSMDDKRYPFEK